MKGVKYAMTLPQTLSLRDSLKLIAKIEAAGGSVEAATATAPRKRVVRQKTEKAAPKAKRAKKASRVNLDDVESAPVNPRRSAMKTVDGDD